MPNRLASESSPYLRQHGGNPVDWYPWGPEAMERARAEDRPILLSIGYSACHWCHVMERESFEDPATAEIMNRSFINIKVDREERPDVDQVYMKAVQAMTGHGGWPLTVFLTPEGTPFYGGTYFPPTPRQGMPSFAQVMDAADQAFTHRRQEVEQGAAQITAAVAGITAAEDGGDDEALPGPGLLDAALRTLGRQYDPAHGGFGRAPKFPQPAIVEFLLRQHARTGDPEPLQMALTTLRRMAAGGIRDHLGGGFHRYSVDARWLVPHFEKMLYDNALLAQTYLDAYRLTGAEDLREVAEDTLDYILGDLTSPEGGFYAARDADSEGEEGKFYVWSPDEVEEVLGPQDATLFCRVYDVAPGGNFEGRSILWLPHDLSAVARAAGVAEGTLRTTLVGARRRLLEARSARVAPFRDEKILLGWNGLALRAFAEAGGALGRPDYVAAAERAATFLLEALRPQGELLHTWKDGEAKVPAFLEDFAALGNALLSLHEATLAPRWLREAQWCCEQILRRFWEPGTGLLHDAASDAEALFVRPRDPMDNATPSGNSLAAELLARLGHLLAEAAYEEPARRLVARERTLMERHPAGFGRLLSVLDRILARPLEVAVVGASQDPETAALLRGALAPFHRNRVVTGRDPGDEAPMTPLLEGRTAIAGRPTAYLCEGYTCQTPVHDPQALAAQFEATRGGP